MLVGVFGTPCGGTGYATRRLRRCGVDAGHEKLGTNGIVCGFWVFGPNGTRPDRPRVCDHSWTALVRLVRHPLRVAETLPPFVVDGQHGRTGPNHPDKRLNALRYWVDAHEKARGYHPRYTVRLDSHLEADLAELCAGLGVPNAEPDYAPESKPQRWPRMTWAGWAEGDPEYAERGLALVREDSLDEPLDTIVSSKILSP
jgi:hypothetical protein